MKKNEFTRNHPLIFTAYPTPTVKVVAPNFRHQNDCKGCKRDYFLCPRSLSLKFWSDRGTLEGLQPPSPAELVLRRGLKPHLAQIIVQY